MRILFSLLAAGGLFASLTGCGAPEAEFAWSDDTQNLVPAARKAVTDFVGDRFGTPGNMVAWQKLPVSFGGIPGQVTETERDEEHNLITSLTVSFRDQAMIARYDDNLDRQLSLAEFPAELQAEITAERFQQADADADGFLSPTEVTGLRVRSELFDRGSVSRISEMVEKRLAEEAGDEENQNDQKAERARIADEINQELIGKEFLFTSGTFAGQKTSVTAVKFDEDLDNANIAIYPPLSDRPSEDDEPVELSIDDVIVDFGKTMKSGRHLYMRHCMHCHGVTGDGNGPTAKYLKPLPRDYRKAVFKFVSTPTDIKHPNRDDIRRVMKNGIPGTYMPSFSMLKDQEVGDIIEYVRWLAMRGEYEEKLNIVLADYQNEAVAEEVRRKVTNYELALKDFEAALADGNAEESDRPEAVTAESERQKVLEDLAKDLEDLPEDSEDEATRMAEVWRLAEQHSNVIYPKVPKPPATPESIARGRQFYLSKCAVCHGVTAEGDGENTRGYQKDEKGNEYAEPGFFDVWGEPIEPRNLNTGIYRGGRRPLDLYRRIHQGIPGTPMQAFNSAFTDEQIWDLVDYVMSIPIDGPIPKSAGNVANSAKPKQPAKNEAAARDNEKQTESSGE